MNQLAQGGKDLGRLLSDLLNHFRNLLIFQISRGDLNLLEVSESEIAALKEQSVLSNSDALMRILDTFAQAELNLRDAASKKIFLEVALLKAIEARNAVSIDLVLKQLNHLRGQGGGGSQPATASSASAPAHSAASAPKAVVQSAAPPKEVSKEIPGETPKQIPQENMQAAAIRETPPVSADLDALWENLVEAVRQASPFVHSYLREAYPMSFEKNVFIIGFDPEFFMKQIGLVDNSRNQTLLQTKLAELGHPNSHVKFVVAEAPPRRPEVAKPVSPAKPEANEVKAAAPTSEAAQPPRATSAAKEKPPVPFNKNDFKNDPLIQKALEIFKGQIVEVRA